MFPPTVQNNIRLSKTIIEQMSIMLVTHKQPHKQPKGGSPVW